MLYSQTSDLAKPTKRGPSPAILHDLSQIDENNLQPTTCENVIIFFHNYIYMCVIYIFTFTIFSITIF